MTAGVFVAAADGRAIRWGETDLGALEQDLTAKYEPEKGDMPPPIYAGATAERGPSRVVVMGASQFAVDRYVAYPDLDIYRRTGQLVSRFPANGQLFMNCIFWLDPPESSMLRSRARRRWIRRG